MKQVAGLFILILSLVFASCQKEASENNNTNPVTTGRVYLDKIYELYDAGAGIDTQYISVCRYDNLNRLTAIEDSVYAPSDNVRFDFYYNGTDTLPYKSAYTENYSGGSDSDIVYHFYNSNQQKLKDSMVHIYNDGADISVSVVNYSYQPGKMYGEIASTGISPASPTVYYRDTATLDANNNITNNKDYIFDGAVSTLNRTSDFTYDNYPNPFSLLNIWKSFSRFPNGETLFWEIMCRNNILTQNEVSLAPNPYTFDPTFTYTYTQNGLTATSVTNGAGSGTDTEIYTYKNL